MESDFKKYIQGTGRKDLTLLFADSAGFEEVIKRMSEPFVSMSINKVVALDALGFVFAAPIAHKLSVGFGLIRKGGKVPIEKESVTFTDYSNTEKVFEISLSAVKAGERILLVDEWSETGSQMKAAITLMQKLGAEVVGITCFNIDQKVKESVEFSKLKLYSVL